MSKKDTNPKDSIGATKADLSLIPASALVHLSLALTEGHLKYGAYNWRVAGVRASIYKAASGRHSEKWWNGEDCDKKSLVHHLANEMACCAIMLDAIECGKLIDDRPPYLDMNELFTNAESVTKHLQREYPSGPGRYTEANNE